MQPKIILTDGTEFDCNFCGVSSTGVIYIDILNSNMLQAIQTFGDKEKVSKIIYRTSTENGFADTEYNNFSVMIGVQDVQNLQGITRISMRRPYVGE